MSWLANLFRSPRAWRSEHDNPFNFLAFCSTCTCIVFVSHYTWLRRLYSENRSDAFQKIFVRAWRRRSREIRGEAKYFPCERRNAVASAMLVHPTLLSRLTSDEHRISPPKRNSGSNPRSARREDSRMNAIEPSSRVEQNTTVGDSFLPSLGALYDAKAFSFTEIEQYCLCHLRCNEGDAPMWSCSARHVGLTWARSPVACLEPRKVLSRFQSPPDCCGSRGEQENPKKN